jgi:hypothetical protein
MSYVDKTLNTDDRMRSISTNAVQEARVAKGRGALPFLDKDCHIQHMIERLLHELSDVSASPANDEHYPLVEKNQPDIGKSLYQINDILDNLSKEIMPKEEEKVNNQPPPIIKASFPKSK